MTFDREFISQVVIVVAVCAGAWLMFVQPRSSELARLERVVDDATRATGDSEHQGLEAIVSRVASSKQRLREVEHRNAAANDTSALYATIMRLASANKVRVQAMQPTPPRDSNGRHEAVKIARLEITLAGAYENVARFLDAVGEIDAFIRPSSLQLIPIDGADTRSVSARYSCDVLAFTIDGALSSAGGAADAIP